MTIEYIKYIPVAFVISSLAGEITYRTKLKPINYLISKLACLKCATFWLTLFVTKDIITASVACGIAYLIDKYIL